MSAATFAYVVFDTADTGHPASDYPIYWASCWPCRSMGESHDEIEPARLDAEAHMRRSHPDEDPAVPYPCDGSGECMAPQHIDGCYATAKDVTP